MLPLFSVHVTVTNRQKDYKVSSKAISDMLIALSSYKRVKCKQISVHLVGKKKIAALHQQFFEDPTPTDCISFPIDDPQNDAEDSILGEIFICPQVAIEYAEKHSLDPQREVSLYLVHGFLHLLGYDDIEPAARRQMRRQEALCLNYLIKQNILL